MIDKQRENAYLQLIHALLTCASGEEVAILREHPELFDEGLVQVMQAEAARMAQQGEADV